MKVYELKVNHSNTTTLIMKNRDALSSHPIRSDFKGQNLARDWQPAEMQNYKRRKFNEFPYLIPEKPIVSQKVMQILKPHTLTEVEFLPLLHNEFELYLMNVTNILDCVDWQRSEAKWLYEKYFMRFDKLVFDFAKIPKDTYLFKTEELATTKVFVTESFR